MVKLKLAYFQYSPEIYEDVRRYVPAQEKITRKDECMKKYRVSKFTSDILIIGLVVLLVALVLDNFLIFQGYEDMDFKTFIPTVVFLIGIACIIYMMYTGVTAYKFSVSYTGITMYEPKHTYEFSWDDFVDYGVAIANVSSPDTQNTFWIYFAKRCLRESEKCVFLRRLEKKHDYIAYFQYSPEIYGEVRRYIPAQMRSQIDRELAPWIENMTFTEKRINR